jgi:hypothetical protein
LTPTFVSETKGLINDVAPVRLETWNTHVEPG